METELANLLENENEDDMNKQIQIRLEQAEFRLNEAKKSINKTEEIIHKYKMQLASKELQLKKMRSIFSFNPPPPSTPTAPPSPVRSFDELENYKNNNPTKNIDSIIQQYKTRFPLHAPFIYWKSLIQMLSLLRTNELKNSIKQHDICKYIKWQILPPKEKEQERKRRFVF